MLSSGGAWRSVVRYGEEGGDQFRSRPHRNNVMSAYTGNGKSSVAVDYWSTHLRDRAGPLIPHPAQTHHAPLMPAPARATPPATPPLTHYCSTSCFGLLAACRPGGVLGACCGRPEGLLGASLGLAGGVMRNCWGRPEGLLGASWRRPIHRDMRIMCALSGRDTLAGRRQCGAGWAAEGGPLHGERRCDWIPPRQP